MNFALTPIGRWMPLFGRRLVLLAGSLAALSLSGCGGGSESTLTGVVTLHGKPASGLLMNFHNLGSGPMAYSLTSEDGSYEVHTGSMKGLPPGKYKLAFEATDPAFPAKYRTIVTSGLEYDIKAGANKIDIPLE